MDLRELARRTEAGGYHALLFTDHYLGPGPAMSAANHPPQNLAPIPMAAVAAEVTRSLVVGFRVLCVDYHNPVVLAKELATLDELSGGRLEIGLGAGWIGSEYAAMGITFDPPPVRVRRLSDVVDVVRAVIAGGEVDVAGTSGVRASGFRGSTFGALRPCPPIAIGGGGPVVLRVAARQADIVSINFNNRSGALTPDGARTSTTADMDDKLAHVRTAAGDRWNDLRIEMGVIAGAVCSDAAAGAARFEQLFGMPAADIVGHPHALVGDVELICDKVHALRERFDITDFAVRDSLLDDFAPVVARLAGT
jgi:probable F420-dependent oxidoreductase